MNLTYAGLLGLFLLVPILLLTLLTLRDWKRPLPANLRGWPPYAVLAVLIGVAIIYTTPWDNHLIVTRVWSYAPTRITGATFGWVPLEELAFFVLQTILVGLWFLWLARRISSRTSSASLPNQGIMRLLSASIGGVVWIIALILLRFGWQAGTYLGWELVWALPPIVLQLSVGADILWGHRHLLCLVFFPALFYLSAVDALAIHQGIWTINPEQSLDIFIGGQLPIEECVFFLLTTTLVIFGLLLGLSIDSRKRLF